MELESIVQFLENKTILVIGATGFLAKIFVEKILRVQPDVKKLYLLLRAADSKSALQRLNTEVFAKDLFRVLKDKWGTNLYSELSEKVTPVAGDITCDDNLGIKESDLLKQIIQQVDVVVNLAATTNFDERYDFALALNTLGAKHVLNFSKKCANLKFLLHVSTAYVSGEKPGLILETPYSMGQALNKTSGIDIDAEIKIVEQKLNELKTQNATDDTITLTMKDLGIQRARKYGWPNTYVFTKAMGEMILGNLDKNFSMAILRPTIITSTYKEPFPGWVEGVRTVDSMIVGFGKGKLTCFLGDPDSTIDCVPADMVVNAMIVAIAAHSKQPNGTIYHVGSADSNPVKYSSIQDYGVRFFTENPWTNKDGNQVKVRQLTVMTSMASFRRYITIRYLLPLKVFKMVNAILCQVFKSTYVELDRKIKFVMRLVELFEPYLFFKGVHDNTNTAKLRMAMRSDNGSETDMFYFDPKCVDWEEYFMDIHIPGLVKYIFK